MFRKHFDHLAQNNSFIKSVVCDSNARLKKLFANDITSSEGFKIGFLISTFGLNQIINKPSNITLSSSCINLIFALQPSLLTCKFSLSYNLR